jgi:hypothetical protein
MKDPDVNEQIRNDPPPLAVQRKRPDVRTPLDQTLIAGLQEISAGDNHHDEDRQVDTNEDRGDKKAFPGREQRKEIAPLFLCRSGRTGGHLGHFG